MVLFGSRLLVALDAASVSGALLPFGLGGGRIETVARIDLASGALVPSAVDENLVRSDEVRDALRDLRRRLGGGAKASLILPDGVARMVLLETPVGTNPRDYARFRLLPSLPFPADEAIIDLLRSGRGRYVAAAVRARVVRSFEAVAVAAGFSPERVDLAPLAALAALLRNRPRGPCVDVILGDTAVCFAGFDESGAMRAFRNRRRDAGSDEAERLGEEADRTSALFAPGTTPRLRVVGTGAPALIRALCFGGRPAQSAWPTAGNGLPVDTAEMAWLGSALV